MIVWQTTKKCILHYSMRSLTHWSRSNSRILAAQKTFSSPPSSKLRKPISPQKAKTVPFPSHARHGVRAVAAGNERRISMAKPCTPHLHSAGGAALRAKNCQCAGSRGKAPRLSLGGFKGGYSLRKESIPLLFARFRAARKFPFPAPVQDYFLKLSFRVTDRLNTRCSAVQSLLSRQKYPRRMNWKLGAVLPFFSVLS